MNRLIKKFPHLTETTIDTLEVPILDTIVLEAKKQDTLKQFFYNDTTIIQYKDNTNLKLFLDSITNMLYAEIDIPIDTVYYETIKQVPFEVEKVVYKELGWWEQYQVLIYIILALFVLMVLYKKLT